MEKFQINADPDYTPTPEQVIFNCNLAEKLWRERVKPAQVNLNFWVKTNETTPECETIACFGGHIGKWPEFLALDGAFTYPNGMPDLKYCSHKNAEFILFGNNWIFDLRIRRQPCSGTWLGRLESQEYSDYEVVLQRIARCRGMAEKVKL